MKKGNAIALLPIGGLKEKTMAALRNGVTTVIIPKENEKDLDEIDQTVRKALKFVPVETVDTVFAAALMKEPVAMTESMPLLGLESAAGTSALRV